ncbi:MAG TPA: tellurite resistance/C4-dicarboxylate transporter family protein [Mycobacterium sp.]|nr:tellurite resistance/C4-dicarboxylate transporter family protein [Mycobacterium sp.]
MRPDAFAAVMATGIVSIAAADHGWDVVSAVLAGIAAIGLPVLMALSAAAWGRESWSLRDLDTAVGLLTYVAACCVLAARFSEHRWLVVALGAMALQGWVSLLPFVIRGLWRLRWVGLRDRAHGAWQLLTVSTSGLAIVFVAGGNVFWPFVLWPLALVFYVVVAALVGWRAVADPSARRDVPADHWILMGGSAIATLAGEHLHAALYPGPIADAVRAVTIATWVIATVQIVPLAIVGWRRVLAWPAVFPLGMYGAATFAIAQETGWPALVEVSLVFTGVALALWLVTAVRESLRFRREFQR